LWRKTGKEGKTKNGESTKQERPSWITQAELRPFVKEAAGWGNEDRVEEEGRIHD